MVEGEDMEVLRVEEVVVVVVCMLVCMAADVRGGTRVAIELELEVVGNQADIQAGRQVVELEAEVLDIQADIQAVGPGAEVLDNQSGQQAADPEAEPHARHPAELLLLTSPGPAAATAADKEVGILLPTAIALMVISMTTSSRA